MNVLVKVSVISPVFNVAMYLPRFFKSLEEQELVDLQIILVDDGSTDNSLALCQQFAKNDKRVIVLHQSNMGTGAARNNGLSVATGDYIYFCDPDDYLDSNLLRDNLNLVHKYHADVIIFGYYMEVFNTTISNKYKPNFKFYLKNDKFKEDFPSLYNDGMISSLWNKLYLRSSLKNLKFQKVRTGQDNRFNIEYFTQNLKILCNDKAYYHYIVNRPDSAQTKLNLDKAYLHVDEIKMLKRMIFDIWGEERNKEYIDLISKQYCNIALDGLRVARHQDNARKEQKVIKNLIDKLNLSQYINYDKRNSKRTNYDIWVIRNRNKKVVLRLDKLILGLNSMRKARK